MPYTVSLHKEEREESMRRQKGKKELGFLYLVLCAVGVSTIFGFSFLFSKRGLETFSPFQLLAFRFSAAAIGLGILALFGWIKVSFKGKRVGLLLLLSLVQPGLYFVFESYGLKYATSSEAGIMIALIPIVVTVFGALFLKEKPSLFQVLFILLSTLGVSFIVVMGGIAAKNEGASLISGQFLGYLLLLGAVFAAAFYNILSRKSSLHFRPIEITFVMMWFGMISFNLLAIVEQAAAGKLSHYFAGLADPGALFSILYLGILSSIVAFFLVNFMLSRLEASRSAIFGNLTTIISILAGVLFRNEKFLWFHLVGSIMILLGVWGTNRFSPSRVRRGKPSDKPAKVIFPEDF